MGEGRWKMEANEKRGRGEQKKIFPALGRGPSAVITLYVQRDTIQKPRMVKKAHLKKA
jgi:hypothetical protein